MAGVPKGFYGPNRDGLGDPTKASVEERTTRSAARLREERDRRNHPAGIVRALQAATDRALGRR